MDGAIGIVLIALSAFLFIKLLSSFHKKKENTEQPHMRSSSKEFSEENTVVNFRVTTHLTSRDIPVYQKRVSILPSLPKDVFVGYVSPSGGYVNYARYLVGGKKQDTYAKRSREFDAKNVASAITQAEEAGFSDPYLIEVIPNRPPTENQLAFAKDIGAMLPDGACFHDVSAIISRIYDDDERAADESLARCADRHGLGISLYSGTKAIMEAVDNLSSGDRKLFRSDLAAMKSAKKDGFVENVPTPDDTSADNSVAQNEPITAKMYPILRPMPSNPRFYNIGSSVFHKSRECFDFSERDNWDAITEGEAIHLDMHQCPRCVKPIVFSYGNTQTYHTTTWCSSAKSICHQLFEDEAITKGMHKCKTCQARDLEGIRTYYGSPRCINAYHSGGEK